MAMIDVGLNLGTIAVVDYRDKTKSGFFEIKLVIEISLEPVCRKVFIEVEIEINLSSELTQISPALSR